MFGWALQRDVYGLELNPAARVKIADLIGAPTVRDRVLSDNELRLVWRAANCLPYPYGPLLKMLMLTGQRVNEMAGARWSEIEGDVLVVPPARMKGKAAHAVPLTPRVVELLDALPRFAAGDFLFTASVGARPVSGFPSKAREWLDREISEAMPPWIVHDIRRTVRTRLSTLGIMPFVAEQVIAHRQTGVQAVYDLHRYTGEKRAALTAWEKSLLAIVDPEKAPAEDDGLPIGR